MPYATDNSVVILSAKRTPIGCFQGQLSTLSAPKLGAIAIQAAVDESGIKTQDVAEVIMGNVLSAGLKQGPARQASRQAGLQDQTGATTINKLCGSGMKAVMLASDMIQAGSHSIMVAGGMESMSNTPYLLPKARSGYRMGHQPVQDHMFLDGLEDAETGRLMGVFAQDTANEKHLSREAMDEFAIHSLNKARQAIETGALATEIQGITVTSSKNAVEVLHDEQVSKANIEKIPTLKAAFSDQGTITAANASSISDGASALVLTNATTAQQRTLKPIANILGHSSHAQHPSTFTTAPIGAINKLLNKLNWSINDVDLFEINEAFAMVAMLPIIELGIDPEKVNCCGGACALGHPIGSTGAKILVTLVHALQRKGLQRGIATLCIGGGEATAVAVECLR